MKKFGQIMLTVILILTLLITVINISDDAKEKQREEQNKKDLINYLERKYGDGNYKIIDIDDGYCEETSVFSSYCSYEQTATLTTDYFDDTFEVKYYKRFYDYTTKDNFIETLYKEEIGNEGIEKFLENEYTKKINKDLIDKKYNNKISLNSDYITHNYLNEFWGHKPTIEELLENTYSNSIYIEVSDYYTKDKLEEFQKDIVDVYKYLRNNKYDYTFYYSIKIKFLGENPYDEIYHTKNCSISYDSVSKTYVIYMGSNQMIIKGEENE